MRKKVSVMWFWALPLWWSVELVFGLMTC